MSFVERKTLRMEKSKPILDKLEVFLKEMQTEIHLPKSLMGGVINYTLKLWVRIIRYIENGRYEIDNNPVERSIRPLALGRKNYMFAGSHEVAQNAVMMYSFFGSCKLNDILEKISDYTANKLLPHNWKK
jgi:hypothetical protein